MRVFLVIIHPSTFQGNKGFSFHSGYRYGSRTSSGVVAGGGGHVPPSDNFLGALMSKGGAKIRNCQCEILYKIRRVQLFNKIKDSSNSGISK